MILGLKLNEAETTPKLKVIRMWEHDEELMNLKILQAEKDQSGLVYLLVSNDEVLETRVLDGFELTKIIFEVEERLTGKVFSSQDVWDRFNKWSVSVDEHQQEFYVVGVDFDLGHYTSYVVGKDDSYDYIVNMAAVSPRFGKQVLKIHQRGEIKKDKDKNPHVHFIGGGEEVVYEIKEEKEKHGSFKGKSGKEAKAFLLKNKGYIRFIWDKLTGRQDFIDEYKDNVELQQMYVDTFKIYSPNIDLG